MEALIIKPKDRAEFNLFLELIKRLGTNIATIESDNDVRLFQAMEINYKTPKVSRQKVFDTLKINLSANEDRIFERIRVRPLAHSR